MSVFIRVRMRFAELSICPVTVVSPLRGEDLVSVRILRLLLGEELLSSAHTHTHTSRVHEVWRTTQRSTRARLLC